MPCADTCDLAEPFMRFAGELLGTPAGCDTLEAMALCHTDGVDHLVLLENGADVHWLFEEALAELDLVGDGAAIYLDLHEVRLLLLERSLRDLGMSEDADDSAVLLDALKLARDRLAAVLCVLGGVLGESLLLRLVPVLVEATLDLV